MLNIDLRQFLKLAEKYNVIPVYGKTLADMDTPLSAYMKIDDPRYSFLLESIEGGEHIARYSFLGRQPYEIFSYRDGVIERKYGNKTITIKSNDPFLELKKIFSKFKCAPIAELPAFTGGAVGYIGYDTIKLYEPIPNNNKIDTLNWPDIYFMFFDLFMIFDHVYHKILVVQNVFISSHDTYNDKRKKFEKAKRKIEFIIKDLKKTRQFKFNLKIKVGSMKALTSPIEFKRNVKKIVNLINNGEAIQVVLSQRFENEFLGDPILIYRNLRALNPSPYMHYLRMGDRIIIGASPELMVRVLDNHAEVRPIAGTRPRGKNQEQDKKFEKELLSNIKERAEHIMLVDLGRNDLGKVCETGSVKVNELMYIEKYSHVMHIVSNVVGRLRKDMDCFDAFKATFPAGTVSGAPKVRAMQIIDDFEKYKRGPYAGAVGVISFSGAMETCISIRSIYYNKGRLTIQTGAGIVADSKPDFEYRETLNKAKAMFEAVEGCKDFNLL
ncbi:MAG: anthranilate synthase component I [Candidatus Goldbacteria bacterium]|nr:anthranilate synthase component I [Candidatus Goldiibacteriota bacterium]